MSKKDRQNPPAPEPVFEDAVPEALPTTIKITTRTLHDDTRIRAGLSHAPKWQSFEVTEEQLKELRADQWLDVRVEGEAPHRPGFVDTRIARDEHERIVAALNKAHNDEVTLMRSRHESEKRGYEDRLEEQRVRHDNERAEWKEYGIKLKEGFVRVNREAPPPAPDEKAKKDPLAEITPPFEGTK